MNWIFIGLLAGSLVTSTHETEEACLGRAEMLRKKEVVGRCERAPATGIISGATTLRLFDCNNGICSYK